MTIDITPEEARALINALDYQYKTLGRNGAIDLAVENRLVRRKIEEAL